MNWLIIIYIFKKERTTILFLLKIDCLYIGFCFAILEIYNVLIGNGFRPKKGKDKEIYKF
jgi:hypothetical protein